MSRIAPILLLAALLSACSAPQPAATPIILPPTTAPSAEPATPPATETPQPTIPPTITPAPRAEPTALPAYDLILAGATLLDGSGAPPLTNAIVAIRAGRIAAVGRAGDIAFAAETPTRDLSGMTLLPGFINTHAHTWELTPDQLRIWTQAGITTMRDLGGPVDVALSQRATLANDPLAPRLLVAGPMVTVPDGHPIPIYGLNDRVLTVRDADEARIQIGMLADQGVDLIKIAVSGRTDTNWPELSNADIAAIVEIARSRGIRVTAHVDRASALQRAVEQGIDDAAHMPRDRMSDELIALMVARGVALTPTIHVYEQLAVERGNLAEWRRVIMPVMYDNLRRFSAAGGILALGDDYGNPGVEPGMPMAEIRHWIAAGLTPMQVIEAATRGGALVCGLEGEIGVIRPGAVADLLAVDGDPLSDIEALARPALALRAGVIVRDGR